MKGLKGEGGGKTKRRCPSEMSTQDAEQRGIPLSPFNRSPDLFSLGWGERGARWAGPAR